MPIFLQKLLKYQDSEKKLPSSLLYTGSGFRVSYFVMTEWVRLAFPQEIRDSGCRMVNQLKGALEIGNGFR